MIGTSLNQHQIPGGIGSGGMEDYALQVAQGLAAGHSSGIIPRVQAILRKYHFMK